MIPSDLSSSILTCIESSARLAQEAAALERAADTEFHAAGTALRDAIHKLPPLLYTVGATRGKPVALRVEAESSGHGYVVGFASDDNESCTPILTLSQRVQEGRPAICVEIFHNGSPGVASIFRYHMVTGFLEAFNASAEHLARTLALCTTNDESDPRLQDLQVR